MRLEKQINILPCPFCGGEAVIRATRVPDGNLSYTTKQIICKKCGCRTGPMIADEYYGVYCTDKELAELWNTRKLHTPL